MGNSRAVIAWCFVLEASYKFSLQTMALLKPQMVVAHSGTTYWIPLADTLHYLLGGIVMLKATSIVRRFGGLQRTALFCLMMRTLSHFFLAWYELRHVALPGRHEPLSPFPTFLVWLVHAYGHLGPLEPFLILPLISRRKEEVAKSQRNGGVGVSAFPTFLLDYAIFHCVTSLIGTVLANAVLNSMGIDCVGLVHLTSSLVLVLCAAFCAWFAIRGRTDNVEKFVIDGEIEASKEADEEVFHDSTVKWRTCVPNDQWTVLIFVLVLSRIVRFFVNLYLPLHLFYQTLMAVPEFQTVNLQLSLPFHLFGALCCYLARRHLEKRQPNVGSKMMLKYTAKALFLAALLVATAAGEIGEIKTSADDSSPLLLMAVWLSSGLFLFVEAACLWLLVTCDFNTSPKNTSTDNQTAVVSKTISALAATNITTAFGVAAFYGLTILYFWLRRAQVVGYATALLIGAATLTPFAISAKQ